MSEPAPEEARPSFFARLKIRWRKAADWCGRRWAAVHPGPEARRGAVWGMLAAAGVCVLIAGHYIQTGFGSWFDFGFALVAGTLIITGVALLVALLMTMARRLPRMATGIIVGSGLVVMLLWGPPQVGGVLAIEIGLAEGLLGAALATLFFGNFRQAALSKKIVTSVICVLALAANVFFVWLFAHEGSMEKITTWRPPAESMPAKLSAADPSQNGPYRVKKLFYAAGSDIRRPEYGPSADIKTRTVDASYFFKEFEGWKRKVRKKYWGFDLDQLPLNARVWYPEGAGPFPLVLIVHGNHEMTDFSDPGYAYLGELLASRGFILASVDENFLNSGFLNDPPKQQAVRGWLLLEHLKLWREWSQTAANPFYGKVDMSRIALMGHSRGGEAAATAALFNRLKYDPEDADIRFDYGFDIKAVVAIAPADGQYKPAEQHRWIEDVSYLTLQGAHDGDVSVFMGSRQWDHVRYTRPGPWFKAEIYAYRANHGQFNTVWGRNDAGDQEGWLLNLKPLMPAEQQRRISKTYISAFLEATLKDHREYLPLFQDWRVARDWIPDTIYLNRYQDASYARLASFDEDPDLTTTTAPGGHIAGENLSIWREGRIPWRSGTREYNGVFLGWNHAKDAPLPAWTLTLPEGAASTWSLTDGSTLELSVAALDQEAPLPGEKPGSKKDKEKKSDKAKNKDNERESPDFTVELVSSDGAVATASVSSFMAIPPPLKEKFTKLGAMAEEAEYNKDWEPVFQTVRAPLGKFQSAPGAAKFDPRKLSAVRLKFDRTPMSVICISGVGFGRQ